MYPSRSLPLLVSLVALAGGCNHTDPFPSGSPVDNGPRIPNPPARITFSTGFDLSPTWGPDGTRLAYSFAREEGGLPADRCLAELPAAGGTRQEEKCLLAADSDSIRALGPVSWSRFGEAAWMDARNLPTRRVPDRESLRIGTLAPNDTGVAVRTFPYPAGGNIHATATSITWLSPSLIAYIGTDRLLVGRCSGCKVDTLLVGKDAVLLDLNASPITTTVIPNTSEVTSLTGSEDGTSIYFTRAGDSRVFQRVLASGSESVLHDFGGPIARDITVRGRLLTAVVGGKVSYGVDPIIGARQIDNGGLLTLVDLDTGNESVIDIPDHLVQHAVLSPGGVRIAMEAVDTLQAPQPDLWVVQLP
ncbi:MAG: hypothetical protein U0133_22145 [Gemmatimonadales bacterium]